MKVVIYTNVSCPHCQAVRDYLDQRQIPYQDKNVTEDLNARMTLIKHKILAVPTICIDDEQWIIGYNPIRLEKYFDSHQ